MAERIPRWLTGLLGVVLAFPFALRWVFTPVPMSAESGISLGSPAAFSHMRGDTGGAFFAVGLLLLLGLWRREPGYLEAVALIMLGIIGGRLLGIALDGFLPQIGVAMAVEAVTAVAALATARQMRSVAS
ncbi:MAG TPA: DUF4345 family protein [Myxococcota bacterium]|nr:DUF4345 family protein [Myxococcota bacterium]